MSEKLHKLHIRIEAEAEGEQTPFEEQLDPSFLDLSKDDELTSPSEVRVRGTACRSGEWVLVEGSIETALGMPCSMCNEQTVFSIGPFVWKTDLPATDVKGGEIDLTDALREAILLEVPYVVKCGGKECRNEASFRQYLVPEATEENEERHQPFRTLL